MRNKFILSIDYYHMTTDHKIIAILVICALVTAIFGYAVVSNPF